MHWSSTYDNLVCYIPALPRPVPDLVLYMLVHLRMEGDWCRFSNVSELLRHKSHCILPIQTNQCSHRARLKVNKKPMNELLFLLLKKNLYSEFSSVGNNYLWSSLA